MARSYLILLAAVAAWCLAACQPKPVAEPPTPEPEAALPAPEHDQTTDGTPAEGEAAVVEVNRGGVCPVSGKSAKGQFYTDYQGKRYYFCCPGCPPEFKADPEKYLAKMDKGVTESQPAEGGTTSGG